MKAVTVLLLLPFAVDARPDTGFTAFAPHAAQSIHGQVSPAHHAAPVIQHGGLRHLPVTHQVQSAPILAAHHHHNVPVVNTVPVVQPVVNTVPVQTFHSVPFVAHHQPTIFREQLPTVVQHPTLIQPVQEPTIKEVEVPQEEIVAVDPNPIVEVVVEEQVPQIAPVAVVDLRENEQEQPIVPVVVDPKEPVVEPVVNTVVKQVAPVVAPIVTPVVTHHHTPAVHHHGVPHPHGALREIKSPAIIGAAPATHAHAHVAHHPHVATHHVRAPHVHTAHRAPTHHVQHAHRQPPTHVITDPFNSLMTFVRNIFPH